jgi:hypothetical protein
MYLHDYFRRTGMTWREVEPWVGIMAAARIAEEIPEEANSLRRVASRRLSQRQAGR